MWTKEQYISWMKTRGNAGTWEHKDCLNADRLIEHETLKKLETYLKRNDPISDFVRVCAKAHFGSQGCDEMLTKLNCYPNWM